MKKWLILAILGLPGLSHGAETLPTIWVTDSAQYAQDDFSSPYTLYTFTAEDIADSGAATLAEFLSTRTPLTVVPNAGNPFTPKMQLPGFDSATGFESLKVIVDGRALNTIDLLPPLLASISIDQVKRITLLQGSGAVRYGDNSAAGVLIIETKHPKHASIEAGAYYGGLAGDFRRHVNAHLNATAQNGSTLYVDVGRARQSTEGDRLIDANGQRNDRQLDNLDLTMGVRGGRYDLAFMLDRSVGTVNYPGKLTVAQYNQDPATNPNNHTLWQFDQTDKGLKAAVKLSSQTLLKYSLNLHHASSAFPKWNSSYTYFSRTHHISLQRQSGSAHLEGGVEWSDANRQSTSNTLEKNHQDVYLQYRNRLFRSTQVNLGVRHGEVTYRYANGTNRLSATHDRWAWQAGLNYALTPRYAVYGQIQRAYVMPNIDRFFTYNFSTRQYNFNGFINPMDTTTYTTGIKFRTGVLYGKLFASHVDVENEFYYDSANGVNTNLTRTHKNQLGTAISLETTKLSAHLTATHTVAAIDQAGSNAVSVNTLPGSPENQVKLDLRYQLAPFITPTLQHAVIVQHQWTSEALAESDFANQFGYFSGMRRTDIALQLRNRRLNFQFGIKNLFSEHNATFINTGGNISVYPIDYDRTYYVQIHYRFSL